jgi:hypothetical protein
MGSLDLIDYVALQKRGLIKKQQSAGKLPITKEGYIDLGEANKQLVDNLTNSSNTQSTLNQSDNSSSLAQTQATSTPGFTSFWDQLPGQTPAQTTSSTPVETTSYYGSQSDTSSSLSNSNSNSTDYSDLASLKVKLDDLEYKLSRLTEKLDMISSRL